MRRLATCLLALALAVSGGCVTASQKANEIAQQNIYQSVEYANAGQAGPTVMVIPGVITTPSYEYLARVSPSALRDFAESEMGKSNFKVLDRTDQPAMFQEIAVAANLGDSSVLAKFKKYKMAPPRWLVRFDVIEVVPRSTGFKQLDKQMAGMAGALMGSMLLGDLGAKAGSATFASISSAEEHREWTLTMRYSVLDGSTGERIHEGQFTDKAQISKELSGFMGFDTSQAGGLQLFTVTQRLVQKAVQEIDAQHKLPAVEQAAQETPKTAKSAPQKAVAEKAPSKGKKAADPAPEQAANAIACTPLKVGGMACVIPSAWTAGKVPTVREVALASNPNIAVLEGKDKNGKKTASALADSLMLQAAGPMVALTAPGNMLANASGATAITGPGVEGRIFVLPGAAAKSDPKAVLAQLEKHFQQAALAESLGVEVVESKSGQKPISVYKYIKIERRKIELDTGPPVGGDDKGREANTKMVSIPHYHNMAVSILPRGNDLILAVILSPEDNFLPQLEGFKQFVMSVS